MEVFPDITGSHYAAAKKAILTLCSNRKGYCIADLAKQLGASIPKVTRIVSEMVDEGYLVVLGKIESSGGRRASLFGLNPDAGYFVGIHVGHEGLTLAVTDFPGNVVQVVENIPFRLESTEESVHNLCGTVRSCLESLSLDLSRIAAYGVDLTGRVNHQTGYSYSYFISE